MREKVEAILDKIRPLLQADGGDVELVDVDDDGVVNHNPAAGYRPHPERANTRG